MMYNYRRVIPMVNLKGRDFLKLLDFTSEEIEYLLELAEDLKAKKKAGIPHRMHEGKNVALIFERQAQEHDAALRSAQTISAWAQPILPKALR